MSNGHVEMDGDGTIMPTDPIDAAASVAHHEIESPQLPAIDMYDNNEVTESMETHEETNMAASYNAPTGIDIDDLFVTPADYIAPSNLFHASTGTFQDGPFNAYNDNYALDSTTNDPFLVQNMDHTGSAAQTATTVDIDKFLDDQEANYTTSAGHNGDADMVFGKDVEMDMDAMATHAPMAEFEQPVIPGMDKYDSL